jgi:hypothetical protein
VPHAGEGWLDPVDGWAAAASALFYVDCGMRKSRFDVPVLSAATALGVVAWFLPPAYAVAVAGAAILTVAGWLARPVYPALREAGTTLWWALGDRFAERSRHPDLPQPYRSAPPGSRGRARPPTRVPYADDDPDAGPEWPPNLVLDEDDDPDVTSAWPPNLDPEPAPPAYGGPGQRGAGAGAGAEPPPEVAALQDALLVHFADTQRLIRDGNAQLIADLREQNIGLLDTLARLTAESAELRQQMLDADRQSRRSSLISFWGGVAISIPIGVLINLATG